MKRSYRPPIWLALLLIATLALVACVRPVPGSVPTATTAAPAVTNPAILSPTPGTGETLPGITPATPIIGTEGAVTTQSPTDSTPAVDPAATATIQAPLPTETPNIALTPQIQPPVAGVETTYTVVRGDNLFRIGLRFGCDFNTLARYNGIPDPARIDVGQVIRIPANC